MDTRRVEPPPTPMPARLRLRVDCITRTGRVAPHYRVRAIGGRGREGDKWRLSEEAAIAAIENDRASFYVEPPGGQRQDIVVGHGPGKSFLRAESDGEVPETLLALPECE